MTGPGSPFPSARILRSAGTNRAIDAEWVICGWRERGKCILLASTAVDNSTLTFARIPQYFQFTDAAEMRARGIGMARHLEADLLAYTLIEADTFAECLAALLFGTPWSGDDVRALGAAGMGRRAGPYAQQSQRVRMTEPCMHRPPGMEVMFCDQPAGHYPATPHQHTLTWDEETGPQPAIGR